MDLNDFYLHKNQIENDFSGLKSHFDVKITVCIGKSKKYLRSGRTKQGVESREIDTNNPG